MQLGFVGGLIFSLLVWTAEAADKPLQIVTTFLPAYCFAANVAGGRAHVSNLLPGSVNLHDYQLTPADLRKLGQADLIVINGLGMENFLEKAVANSAPGTAEKIIRLSDGLEAQLIDETASAHHRELGHEHVSNPHIWLDPVLAMHSVSNILAALQRVDAAHAAEYNQNATQYCERLRLLDSEVAQSLEPVRNTPFVTYHNAFPYFVRHYGLTLLGVVEQVPEVPPSPREISHLLQAIRVKKGRALFTEPGGSTRLAEQIARDAKLTLGELDPIETGTLDPRTYEQAMRRNVANLKKALTP